MTAMPPPTIGRIVIYRSRTGNYSCPAIVTATVDSLAPGGVNRWRDTAGAEGVPPLSAEDNVHLSVFTPGLPGLRVAAQDFEVESEHPRQENVNGIYQEWDVPFFDVPPGYRLAMVDVSPVLPDGVMVQDAGSWTWPQRV